MAMRRTTIAVTWDDDQRPKGGGVDAEEWAYTLRMGGIDAESVIVIGENMTGSETDDG